MSAPAEAGNGRAPTITTVAERIDALDWQRIGTDLDTYGNAVIHGLVAPMQCRALAALYRQDDRFRSRVVMLRAR